MRILITGGFGFIGGRLGQHLCQVGHQIVLGSRNAIRQPDWLSHAEVVQTDWRDGRALMQSCEGVDVVIHGAGMNAQDCAADPVAALEFNGLATARLVDAAERAGVRRLIYLSTAHVYASPLEGIISEDTCPRTLHPYATSHLAGENAVLNAGRCGQLEGIVLRLSNVFGVPVHKNVNCWMLLVNDLCRQAVETGKMVLRTSGYQQRDFISLGEVCRLIEKIIYFNFPHSVSVFNIGSGVSYSVFEMAELIQKRCNLFFGFRPHLLRPESHLIEKSACLEYQTNIIKKMGLTVSTNFDDEIDMIMHFCQMHFKCNSVCDHEGQ